MLILLLKCQVRPSPTCYNFSYKTISHRLKKYKKSRVVKIYVTGNYQKGVVTKLPTLSSLSPWRRALFIPPPLITPTKGRTWTLKHMSRSVFPRADSNSINAHKRAKEHSFKFSVHALTPTNSLAPKASKTTRRTGLSVTCYKKQNIGVDIMKCTRRTLIPTTGINGFPLHCFHRHRA